MGREAGRERIDAIVADPMVRAVMRADHVDPEALKALLLEVLETLPDNKPARSIF